MIIPNLQLEKDYSSNQKTLIHKPTNIRLKVMLDGSNKAYVEQLDSIGNMKSQKEFVVDTTNKFKGFFEAIKFFEEEVGKKMGGEDKFGFEDGMVWTLQQDVGKYKKGDTFLITKASPDGTKIIEKVLLQPNEVDYLKQVGTEIKQNNPELDILKGKGITNYESISETRKYKLDLAPNTILPLPNNSRYGKNKLQIGNKIILKDTKEVVEIEDFMFVTDDNGDSVLSAKVFTEDGQTLTVPLSKTKPNKNEILQKQTQPNPSTIGLPSTDPATWNAEYQEGDIVKLRNDMEQPNRVGKQYVITSVQMFPLDLARPENPTAQMYILADIDTNEAAGNWEGKDLESIV